MRTNTVEGERVSGEQEAVSESVETTRQNAPALARYRVEYEQLHPVWCEVMASNPQDAVLRARLGEVIEGSLDSEPGKKNLWTRAHASLANGTKTTER